MLTTFPGAVKAFPGSEGPGEGKRKGLGDKLRQVNDSERASSLQEPTADLEETPGAVGDDTAGS